MSLLRAVPIAPPYRANGIGWVLDDRPLWVGNDRPFHFLAPLNLRR